VAQLQTYEGVIRFADLQLNSADIHTQMPKLRKGTLKGYKALAISDPEARTYYRLRNSVMRIKPFPKILRKYNIDRKQVIMIIFTVKTIIY
jgi:hypothetical protein